MKNEGLEGNSRVLKKKKVFYGGRRKERLVIKKETFEFGCYSYGIAKQRVCLKKLAAIF